MLALRGGVYVLTLIMAERRWFRFSLDRPCVVAQIALWIGAHDRALNVLCLALLGLVWLWR